MEIKESWIAEQAVNANALKNAKALVQSGNVGFIIGVIQDSCETGINSSTDVLYTAIADFRDRRIHPERYADKPFDPEIKIM